MATVHTELIGRSLEYADVPPVWVRWLEQTWLTLGPQAPPHPYRLVLETTAPLLGRRSLGVSLPDDATTQIVHHFDRSIAVETTSGGWRWGDVRRGMVVDVSPARLRVRVWGLGDTPPGGDLAVLLSLALQEGLRTSGLLPLHGAAAIPPEGASGASLFIGPSGRGKTTTLLRAMRAGWAPVCEDTVWLEPATLQLYSGDRGLRLLPDTVDELLPTALAKPTSKHSPQHLPQHYKTFVPFSDLSARFGVTWQPSARLDRVVALLRGHEGWQPLSRLEAVPHLWEATFLPLLPHTRQQTARQIARTLGQVRLARLAVDKPLDRFDLFLEGAS